MKNLFLTFPLTLTVLLLSSTEGWSLPLCKGSASTWTNCMGTYAYANGEKYVGEFKDGAPHGQGTYTREQVSTATFI